MTANDAAAGPYSVPDATAAPPATRATAPGTGTPMASAKTISEITVYPWRTIRERRSLMGSSLKTNMQPIHRTTAVVDGNVIALSGLKLAGSTQEHLVPMDLP